MSGCLALDDGIPDLTSRLLLLLEDEDDLIAAHHKSQKNLASTQGIPSIRNILEETKESEAMVVSPCSSNNDIKGSGIISGNNNNNNMMERKTRQHPRQEHRSSPLWSSPLPRFDTIPECSLPSIPLPPPSNPATPLSTTRKGMGSAGGLYASFSSTPVSQDLWQYNKGEETHKTKTNHHHHHPSPSFLSPRTTDAVYGDSRRSMRTIDAVWGGPHPADNSKQPCNLPPMAPSLSLLPECIPHETNRSLRSTPRSHHNHRDGPPSVICCYRTRSNSNSSGGSSLGSSIGFGAGGGDFDDDEVSLLADDPDEDDAGVLPPATYDVVVNILDEIDNSNE